jgi:hypothetical protein
VDVVVVVAAAEKRCGKSHNKCRGVVVMPRQCGREGGTNGIIPKGTGAEHLSHEEIEKMVLLYFQH